MSKQTSQHGFPQPDEEDEELDLPTDEALDIEYDYYDHNFRDYLGEDADQEEDEPELYESDYDEYDDPIDWNRYDSDLWNEY